MTTTDPFTGGTISPGAAIVRCANGHASLPASWQAAGNRCAYPGCNHSGDPEANEFLPGSVNETNTIGETTSVVAVDPLEIRVISIGADSDLPIPINVTSLPGATPTPNEATPPVITGNPAPISAVLPSPTPGAVAAIPEPLAIRVTPLSTSSDPALAMPVAQSLWSSATPVQDTSTISQNPLDIRVRNQRLWLRIWHRRRPWWPTLWSTMVDVSLMAAIIFALGTWTNLQSMVAEMVRPYVYSSRYEGIPEMIGIGVLILVSALPLTTLRVFWPRR